MFANFIAYTLSIGLFGFGIALAVELVKKNHRYDTATIRGGSCMVLATLAAAWAIARYAIV